MALKKTAVTYLHEPDWCPSIDLAGAFEFKNPEAFVYRVPSFHLILLARGTLEAQTPYGQFRAEEGCLVNFRPAGVNQYQISSGTRFYQIHLHFAPPPRHQMVPWLESRGPLPLCLNLRDGFKDAENLFESFCLEIHSRSTSSRLRMRAAVFELMALVCDQAPASRQPSQRIRPDPWQRMRIRLESHPENPPAIRDLAREMSVSTDYFIRQFRAKFGLTPHTFRIHARLREGARRLRHGNALVKEVALALGFKDSKSFSRLFKRHLGCDPSSLKSSAGPPPADLPKALPRTPFVWNQNFVPRGSREPWQERYRARP